MIAMGFFFSSDMPALVLALNGKSSLSPEMALRLERGFGISMDLLLKMQAWHDAVRMRLKADEVSVERYAPA